MCIFSDNCFSQSEMAEWRRSAFGEPPPLFPAAASMMAAQQGMMQVLAMLNNPSFKGLNCPASLVWVCLCQMYIVDTFDARVARDPGMRVAIHQDGSHSRCRHQSGNQRQQMIPTGDTRKLRRDDRATEEDFCSKGILKLTPPLKSVFQFG